MPDCHTSTGEWQRFEERMRRRRADNCLRRASAALDADVPEVAEALLAEAEALCRKHPDAAKASGPLPSSNDPLGRATPNHWLSVVLALTLLSLLVASCW